MGKITEQLLRKRAEHNEGMLSSLEEVALHQENIEEIDLLGRMCPHLKILYLQNNLICRLKNLNKLKELEYLNIALNNIVKVQNLQRCESLQKLDLTANFVDKKGLLSLASLRANYNLKELMMVGNPCTDWPDYRQFVIAKLPQLQRLDGKGVKHSERILAQQHEAEVDAKLRAELAAEGVDVDEAANVEDDSLDPSAEVAETGYLDEKGELKRPWCPATRILEHREMEEQNRKAQEAKKPSPDPFRTQKAHPRRETFPELQEGQQMLQCNEGQWDFTLDESDDGRSLVLDVDIGKYVDLSLVKLDLQPRAARMLLKGRLLQLQLPVEVRPDAAVAQRSKTTGWLAVTLPKEDPTQSVHNVVLLRPKADRQESRSCSSARKKASERDMGNVHLAANPGRQAKRSAELSDNAVLEVHKAVVQEVDSDDDSIPPL